VRDPLVGELLVHSLDLISDDAAIARRALAGEPVLILPYGPLHRNGEERHVDEGVVDEFVYNWEHRLERGIRRSRLAVDVDHKGGAVGWYTEIFKVPEGLGATFSWTRRGRKSLEAGEYAYFSPTLYWWLEDPVTGETVRNQIAGGAITNYPYFGEHTALYTMEAARYFALGGTMSEQNQLDPVLQFFARLLPFINLPGVEAGQVPATQAGTAQAFAQLPPEVQEQLEAFGGLQAQVQTMSTQLQGLETNLATVTAERDTYRQQLDTVAGSLGEVQDARAQERFARMAEGYAHLPSQPADLAGHLRWLYGADATEGQEHVAFFTDLLQRADRQFAEAFAERGASQGRAGDALEQFNRAVASWQKDHPEASYADAVDAVNQQQPELYIAYQREREGGGA
jgi:hypothetical protein